MTWLAVIAAASGFVLWFQSLHTTKARSPLRIVFEGSASGLRNGGSVNFNGIRVGEVVSVKLDDPRRVVALAMVENSAPIRKDTLVGLEFQGLTGLALNALKFVDVLPPGVQFDGRRFVVNLGTILERYGAAAALAYLTDLSVTTVDGRVVVRARGTVPGRR